MTTLKNPDDSGGGRHVTPNPHAFYYVKEKPRAEVAPHVTGAGAPLTGTGRQVCAAAESVAGAGGRTHAGARAAGSRAAQWVGRGHLRFHRPRM